MFRFEPSTLRALCGAGGPPDRGWNHRVAQEHGETLPRGRAVLSLRTVFGGADREDCARETRRELIERPCALDIIERRCRTQIKAQLDARVRGVDALTARTGRAGEQLDEFTRGHPESTRRAGSWGHEQVIHLISVP